MTNARLRYFFLLQLCILRQPHSFIEIRNKKNKHVSYSFLLLFSYLSWFYLKSLSRLSKDNPNSSYIFLREPYKNDYICKWNKIILSTPWSSDKWYYYIKKVEKSNIIEWQITKEKLTENYNKLHINWKYNKIHIWKKILKLFQ